MYLRETSRIFKDYESLEQYQVLVPIMTPWDRTLLCLWKQLVQLTGNYKGNRPDSHVVSPGTMFDLIAALSPEHLVVIAAVLGRVEQAGWSESDRVTVEWDLPG